MEDSEERLNENGVYFNNIMDPDGLCEKWMLTNSPYPVASALIVYLIILKYGPKFMERRDAYQLKRVMRTYNMLQVLYNSYLVLRFTYFGPEIVAALAENLCSLEDDPTQYRGLKNEFLNSAWHYLVLKVLDLLDTIFIILRKKNSHLSFLHVYHHVGMVCCSWFAFYFSKSHHMVMPAVVNLVVHAVMYSYYFLATFTALKKWLWWKRYLTRLQLGQFVVVIMYIFLLHHHGCTIPTLFTYVWLTNVTVILLFFVNFYVQAYVKPKQDKAA